MSNSKIKQPYSPAVDTAQKKCILEGEGHCTYFIDGGNNFGWGHRSTLKQQAETFQNLNFP